MNISTKGRYGLRALVDLIVNSNNEPVSLISIAKRQSISLHYLEQIFSSLRKSGIVKSVKGAEGGYIILNPKDLSVGSILRVLEGSLSLNEEKSENLSDEIIALQQCIQKNVWDKINESINEIFDNITLCELADNYKAMSKSNSMYFI